MNNFYCYNPTKIIFGQGMIERIKFEIPEDARVLMVYGCGSIKANGVYDQVKTALADIETFEFGGITPNPEFQDCMEAAKFAVENNISYLLAVGGGSVIDAVKFIAIAIADGPDNAWDVLTGTRPTPPTGIPYGCVLTAPATGSEINNGCVISDSKTKQKLSCGSMFNFPKFSLLEPSTATSLSDRQAANGIIDTFVHVLEQYMTYPNGAPLQERQAEAILLTVRELGPQVMQDKSNVELWNSLTWCSTQAMMGIISRGVAADWATHQIAHHLTALHGIDHARTLAIVLPGLWEHQFENKKAMLAQYGERVWNLSGDPEQVARKAIESTEQFFIDLGVPTRLSDYQLDGKAVAAEVAARFADMSHGLGEHQAVDQQAIQQILLSRS